MVKVVLQEHVEHLGDRGDVVKVAAGYARNYLLPKNLALEATAGNLRRIEEQRKVWEVKEAREVGDAQAVADKLDELELEVLKKAGETGTLYGSVTTAEIAQLLVERGVRVDRRRIQLAQPIKAVGSYEIGIKLHPKVSAGFKLHVLSEYGGAPAPAPEEREAPTGAEAQAELEAEAAEKPAAD